jgi:hypothetical protein
MRREVIAQFGGERRFPGAGIAQEDGAMDAEAELLEGQVRARTGLRRCSAAKVWRDVYLVDSNPPFGISVVKWDPVVSPRRLFSVCGLEVLDCFRRWAWTRKEVELALNCA